ncbi:MAG: WecB/TagA/CpsF family glycosyltransferase, partial [Chthonomonadales bacterium]
MSGPLQNSPRDTVAILGVPIDKLDMQQVLAKIDRYVKSRRFHQIATANSDFLLKAHQDPELRAVLRMSDMVVADGMPIVRSSKWLKSPLAERVTGADLVPLLASQAAAKGYRIFMLGAKQEVAERARKKLEADNPGLKIVGAISPPLTELVRMDNVPILRAIEEANPDILLVAFGNPKQEKWIHMHREILNVPVCIGIGGTFDFIAGEIPRAPKWVQSIGMEWLYRLCQEPRRLWKRYVHDIGHFGKYITAQMNVMSAFRGDQPFKIEAVSIDGRNVVRVSGKFLASDSTDFVSLVDPLISEGKPFSIDLSTLKFIDSGGLSAILTACGRSARKGLLCSIIGATGQPAAAIRHAGTDP